MPKAFLMLAGLILMLGVTGCEYNYAPMDAKDVAAHPLKPLPVDYRAQIWLKLAPTYSRTDEHFARWDFYAPQGWKEGHILHDHPVGDFDYEWRCDLIVTFLRPKHEDKQTRYTFVYKDGQMMPEDMTGVSPKELLSPTSSLPYISYDVALDQVSALAGHLPDKNWTVDNQAAGISPTPGVRALYFTHAGDATYDSAIYLVEKLTLFNGWKYSDDAKTPTPIAETPVYYVYAFKGPGAWPTFEKDALAALFPGSPTDPGVKIGARP
ncbi:MAG TPA: hypothetical protein VFE47_03100 [Tepidisphaeraceae bacterium]|nr:hypothetical protein [Tepidisphaeraceae bacterium]